MVQDKWDIRFLQMAKLVSTWSSCISRQVGAVITKNNRVLTTGYNGAPSGVKSCAEKCECKRKVEQIESGTRLDVGYAVHAEQNAITQAARQGIAIDGAYLYCTHQPCSICSKLIINSGIKKVVYIQPYPDEFAIELMNEANIKMVQLSI